jgi:hypothetical protein
MALGFAVCAGTMFAANQISWVASNGVDNAACGARTAPCRSFAGALSVTADGGVIKAIDAADYSLNGSQLTIQKPITIDGAGTGASFIGATNAIVVNLAAQGTVLIRDLIINVPPSLTAIGVGVGVVHIENTTITGAPGYSVGINIGASGTVTTNHVTITGAANAVQMLGGNATFRNTIFRNNNSGILASAGSSGATVMIEGSQFTSNQSVGVASDGGSNPAGCVVRISNSLFNSNGIALRRDRGGQIFSYGNNVIDGNTDDGLPPVLIPLK